MRRTGGRSRGRWAGPPHADGGVRNGGRALGRRPAAVPLCTCWSMGRLYPAHWVVCPNSRLGFTSCRPPKKRPRQVIPLTLLLLLL